MLLGIICGCNKSPDKVEKISTELKEYQKSLTDRIAGIKKSNGDQQAVLAEISKMQVDSTVFIQKIGEAAKGLTPIEMARLMPVMNEFQIELTQIFQQLAQIPIAAGNITQQIPSVAGGSNLTSSESFEKITTELKIFLNSYKEKVASIKKANLDEQAKYAQLVKIKTDLEDPLMEKIEALKAGLNPQDTFRLLPIIDNWSKEVDAVTATLN